MARRPSAPPECAQCGEAIPPGAYACPHCGADERTGWRESDYLDGVDLPPAEDAPEQPGPQSFFSGWVGRALLLGLLLLLITTWVLNL